VPKDSRPTSLEEKTEIRFHRTVALEQNRAWLANWATPLQNMRAACWFCEETPRARLPWPLQTAYSAPAKKKNRWSLLDHNLV
jgi:hypothetical protein